MLYRSLQRLYQNAIYIRVVRLGWYTTLHIIGIVYLLYDVARHCPVCVKDCGTRTAMEVRKLYTSVQLMYQTSVFVRVLPFAWCTAMRIIWLVHLLYELSRYCPFCVKTLWHRYGEVSRNLYTSVQSVYQNAGCTTVVRFVWLTSMYILSILHLLYEVPRYLIICVKSLCGHLYGNVNQQFVQINTAVVLKSRLRQSSHLGVLYCHHHYRNCTPTVWGTTGSPNLCTKAVWAPVQQRRWASCTDSYSSCIKMPFASEFPNWGVYYHARFAKCTPTVRCAIAPPSFCIPACGTHMTCTLGRCTELYSVCTKTLLPS